MVLLPVTDTYIEKWGAKTYFKNSVGPGSNAYAFWPSLEYSVNWWHPRPLQLNMILDSM